MRRATVAPAVAAGLALAATLSFSTPAAAQAPTGSGIPTPSEFHGFDVGERYIVTSAVVDYYRTLAERSPRVEYMEYGRSIQGRPLPLVVIGSEQNLARQDEIRRGLERLTHVTEPLPEAELERLVAELPALVWILIVDTDEEAGVNVLQEVAHALATREDAEARSVRDNVLVVMTPLTNPDSHARYVNWRMLYDVKGAATDPNAVENRAHWGMNTDGNAHGVDVNRDFGWFVSPEMRALATVAMEWRPHFWLDIHSGPNVLFMPPFPRPYHPLWPSVAPKWWNAVAERAGDDFGVRGMDFFSRSDYVGHTQIGASRSWAMVGPAIAGFLYETFGGRPGKTTAFVRDDGNVATMRQAMETHDVGTWALLKVARDNRAEILRDGHRSVVDAVREARTTSVRSVILPAEGPGVDPAKLARIVDRLRAQRVEVQRTSQPFTARARDFFGPGAEQDQRFPAGSFVIDMVQPNARLARALLDPTLDYLDPQVEVPFERKMPYYDVTWGSLPYLFGVPAFASRTSVQVGGTVAENGPDGVRGEVRALTRAEPAYAYLLSAGRETSYRTVVALMQEGYQARVFRTPLRIGDAVYPKGTFALLRTRNSDTLPARLRHLAAEHGTTVVEVAGPFTDAGATFGDEARLAAIPSPLVAVLADWPIGQDHTFGGIRSTLEVDFGFTFSPVMLSTLNRADLSKYTAVVLPHAGMDMRGGPNFNDGYRGLLDVANLRRYVLGGGTVIATKGAADVLAEDPVLGADVDFEGYAEYTNGAILRAEWVQHAAVEDELTTWRPGLDVIGMPMLGAGYERPEFAAPAAYPVRLSVREGGAASVIARYVDDAQRLLLDGYMLDEDRPRLAGSPFVVVQRAGRGRVIYFADEPTFRGYWYGLNLLFLNSLLIGPLQ